MLIASFGTGVLLRRLMYLTSYTRTETFAVPYQTMCYVTTVNFNELFFQDILDWGLKIVPHWETLRRKAEHCYILTLEILVRFFTSVADP
jgi:hypothetical protein